MGYNTTILILNDCLDQIKKHPEEFVDGIWDLIARGVQDDVPVGNCANPVYVMRTEHADVFRLYCTHANSILELSEYNRKTVEMARDEQHPWMRESILASIKNAERELRQLKKAILE